MTDHRDPTPADPVDLAAMVRLRDEMRALIALIPSSPAPMRPPQREGPDGLSDEDAVEAGFDNLPV